MEIQTKSFVTFSAAIIHLAVSSRQNDDDYLLRWIRFSTLEFYASAEQDRNLGFGGLDGRGRKKQDPPIMKDLLLALDDCYHGAVKKIKISRRVNFVSSRSV